MKGGDAVRVFSRSADVWVDGEVVNFVEGNLVRVEYEVGGYRCDKSGGETIPGYEMGVTSGLECVLGGSRFPFRWGLD